jgi:hypothetical protein
MISRANGGCAGVGIFRKQKQKPDKFENLSGFCD